MRNVSAFIKKEKIQNDITGRNEEANESTMDEMETLMGATGNKRDIRERLVAKLASWRVERPNDELNFAKVFEAELSIIARRIYESKEEEIKKIKTSMMMLGSEDYNNLPKEVYQLCENTFENLEKIYHYTRKNAWESLIFINSLKNNFKHS